MIKFVVKSKDLYFLKATTDVFLESKANKNAGFLRGFYVYLVQYQKQADFILYYSNNYSFNFNNSSDVYQINYDFG